MSLHWILALTLTLTLTHCLTTNDSDKLTMFTKDAFRSILELKNITCNEPNSMFYSPSGSECIIQALKCSIEELKTVKAECFENINCTSASKAHLQNHAITGHRYASRLSRLITLMLENVSIQNRPTNCFCEGSPTKSYHDFLMNVKTLIQKLNSSVKQFK